jgi:hypothetical protein
MMNSRIAKLQEELKKTPRTQQELRYKGERKFFPVHKLRIDLLSFNSHNGRIGSYVKSYQRQHGEISEESKQLLIQEFLWQSSEARNKGTLADLKSKGQQLPGIITQDGVIIDGNRRAMLLNRIAGAANEPDAYFDAIVLPDALEGNEREILRLETEYQMGSDEKVGYGAIEKYLKCRQMLGVGFSTAEIAGLMSVKETEIKDNLGIMDLMDEYLNYIECKEIYTRLNKTEDLFINLYKALKTWKKGPGKLKWQPKAADLEDFKQIAFDWIRYVYNNPKKGVDVEMNAKQIRADMISNSSKSIFANKEIWNTFKSNHFQAFDNFEELSLDDALERAEEHVTLDGVAKQRDRDFAKRMHADFQKNWNIQVDRRDNELNRQQPLMILKQIKNKLDSLAEVDFAGKPDLVELKAVSDAVRKQAEDLRNVIRDSE